MKQAKDIKELQENR